MILAKCCHDLDMINWLMGDRCTTVSSFGKLSEFKSERAPAGSDEYCHKCKLRGTCLYSAVERSQEMPFTMNVPYGFDYKPESIRAYLENENNSYGR